MIQKVIKFPEIIPYLENGDRLTRSEFEMRYGAIN